MNIFWITKLTDDTLHKISQLEMVEELRKRGHTVTIVMAKNFGEKKLIKNETLYLPTISHPILSGLIFGLVIFFCFPFIIRKKQVDIVIINQDVWLPFTLTLKFNKFPLILDIRSIPIDKKRSILRDIALSLSKYLINGLTTITPELCEFLKERYKLQQMRTAIWSSGFSMKNFNSQMVKQDINITKDSDTFIVLYHGSYSPTRGIEELIQAMAIIKDPLQKKIKLLMIGFSADVIAKLSDICKKIHVNEQVIFVPPVRYQDIPSYISFSDVGIIPLPPENKWWRVSSPLKTLEYLAMNKPIIATNIPFHERLFKLGECGVLVKEGNPKALAQAITHIYQNKEKLNQMGKVGREIVEKYYSWDSKALELEKFLQTILKSH